MSESEQGERTEEATPEKERKAREEGQFARSKDGGAVAASAAVLLCILALGSSDVRQVRELALYCFGSTDALLGGNVVPVVTRLAKLLLWLIVPVSLAAAIGGASIGMVESGLLLDSSCFGPKWERLNPITRIPQLFSPKQGALNVLSALLRVAVLGFVTFSVVRDSFPSLVKLTRSDSSAAVMTCLRVGLRISVWSVLALSLLALLDYGQSWWRLKKELMMSREELKEEFKRQEGEIRRSRLGNARVRAKS
ncbi:MAG: EscU/YscU/HrcU family type III secretion system export apparatus switch protein [Polyangiaceae bacterium]